MAETKKKKKHDFVLREQPFVELRVKAFRGMRENPDGSRQGVFLSFTMGGGSVLEDDGGEVIGHVDTTLNGGVMLTDKRREYNMHYLIPIDEIWDAFQEALDREEKCAKKSKS